MTHLTIYVDGGIAGGDHTGIAAIARSPQGEFLGWESRQLPPMSNNEAEYEAALLGLRLAQQLRAQTVEILSDSEILVNQMRGHSRVHSPHLQPLHQQLCYQAAHFKRISFRHISRAENQLADALAADALRGQCVHTRLSHIHRLLSRLPKLPPH